MSNIIKGYVLQFHNQGVEEEKVKSWVTKQSLKQWLGQDLITRSVECKGVECESLHPPPSLLYNIMKCPFPYVALVQNRQLIRVVNRHELAVVVADNSLQQQLQYSL